MYIAGLHIVKNIKRLCGSDYGCFTGWEGNAVSTGPGSLGFCIFMKLPCFTSQFFCKCWLIVACQWFETKHLLHSDNFLPSNLFLTEERLAANISSVHLANIPHMGRKRSLMLPDIWNTYTLCTRIVNFSENVAVCCILGSDQ